MASAGTRQPAATVSLLVELRAELAELYAQGKQPVLPQVLGWCERIDAVLAPISRDLRESATALLRAAADSIQRLEEEIDHCASMRDDSQRFEADATARGDTRKAVYWRELATTYDRRIADAETAIATWRRTIEEVREAP